MKSLQLVLPPARLRDALTYNARQQRQNLTSEETATIRQLARSFHKARRSPTGHQGAARARPARPLVIGCP